MASAEQAHPNLELKNQRKAAALEDTSSPCHEHALNVIELSVQQQNLESSCTTS
jgi:hypothetical protein